MNYEEALAYIHQVRWQGSKPGLSRTRELLEALGNPQQRLRFIHIAGTNGKGSTAAMLESILRAAGFSTGLYTSPYIRRFNERIRIGGEDISDDDLVRLIAGIREKAEAMIDPPTEFELITALALRCFEERGCEIVVLETGLGGLLDSTNVIDTPELAVITAIGLDHTEVLGPTIEDIAAAKAGIIKPGGEVVVFGNDERANAVFSAAAAEKHARLQMVDFSRLTVLEESIRGSCFDFGAYRGLFLPLAGSFQPDNAAVALTAVEVLRRRGFKIPDGAVVSGLAGVRWPGRFEILSEEPLFILDGAHNPHGMAAAARGIARLLQGVKPVVLLGVMADKDISEMLTLLIPHACSFVCVAPDHPRALDAGALAKLVRAYGGEAVAAESIADGVTRAREYAAGGPVCALGSLYFSADVRRAVRRTE
jgi:dihydrofolate synthase/folylpolyglutamate synthase